MKQPKRFKAGSRTDVRKSSQCVLKNNDSRKRRKKTHSSPLVDVDRTNIISPLSNDVDESDGCVRRSQRLRRKSLLCGLNSTSQPKCDVHTSASDRDDEKKLTDSPFNYCLPSSGELVGTVSNEQDYITSSNSSENKENERQEPPEWLLRPYVAPALRGLETIEEVVTPVSHEAPSTGPKYVSSRRRRDGGGGTRCFKPPPRPLPQQPSAAPLRMQSFNDAAVIEEICSNPTSDLAKFHLAAAQTRVRRQRAMLRKIKRRPGDVVTISEETERRFQTFILAAALGDDDDD